MKLVHIISSLGVGGAETFLLRLTERHAPDIEVHVISLSSDGPIGSALADLAIPVISLGMRPGRFDLIKFIRLIFLLRRLRPDIVQTWMYHADLLGGVAARLAGIPNVIWSIRHSNLSREANRYSTLVVAWICARLSRLVPKKIVSNANAARVSHIAFGYSAEAMQVIPNGLDLSKFQPDADARISIRSEAGVAEDVPLVGCIARFDVQKGHAVFLKAARSISASIPEARFLMAGRGITLDNQELVQLIERNGVSDHAILLGPRSDIRRVMAALDILILPSIGEGFPNVVVEAMACSVPCVVTEAGDAPMIVGSVGIVLPVGDADGLAQAAVNILSRSPDQRREMGMRARERVQNLFDLASVAMQYDRLYREMIGR